MNETDSTVRIIKKYPNRRVYDTTQSKYIKIDDLRQMIIDGVDFQVIDSQSKGDVTRSVVLQIILEQESETNPLFTTENLKNFIRYSTPQQHQFFSDYLSQSLNFFNQQQEQFSSNLNDMMSKNPVDAFNDFNKKNMEMWGEMQKSFFEQFTSKK